MFQKSNNNFVNCPKCKVLLIIEEFTNHSCFKVKNIFIDKKRIWISDGKEWYRWYGLPPNFKHPNGTPRDSTEPIIIIYKILS